MDEGDGAFRALLHIPDASQAAARGVSQALIKQVVQNGVKSAGQKGTSVFTQGSGANRIRVIVDNKTGNIITVTKG